MHWPERQRCQPVDEIYLYQLNGSVSGLVIAMRICNTGSIPIVLWFAAFEMRIKQINFYETAFSWHKSFAMREKHKIAAQQRAIFTTDANAFQEIQPPSALHLHVTALITWLCQLLFNLLESYFYIEFFVFKRILQLSGSQFRVATKL